MALLRISRAPTGLVRAKGQTIGAPDGDFSCLRGELTNCLEWVHRDWVLFIVVRQTEKIVVFLANVADAGGILQAAGYKGYAYACAPDLGGKICLCAAWKGALSYRCYVLVIEGEPAALLTGSRHEDCFASYL